MSYRTPQLARYFQLLHEMNGETQGPWDLRNGNQSEKDRQRTCRRRKIPYEARGDLGYEFVHYTSGDEFDIFIAFLVQYICMELAGQAHMGALERVPDLGGFPETHLFGFLADLVEKDSETRKALDEIIKLPIEKRREELSTFLEEHLADGPYSFVEPIKALFLEGRTKDFVDEFYTYCRAYGDEYVVPC